MYEKMKREKLEKIIQYIDNQNASLIDLLIHQCIESIELNIQDIKPNVAEFIEGHYQEIHQMTKDAHIKDSSKIDIWDLTVFSIAGLMLEFYMKEQGINYTISKWDIINSLEIEFIDFMDGFNVFKAYLLEKEEDPKIIELIVKFVV